VRANIPGAKKVSAIGLLEMVEPYHIHVNRLSFMKDVWWFHYDEARYQFMTAMADTFFAPGILARTKGLVKMVLGMRKLNDG